MLRLNPIFLCYFDIVTGCVKVSPGCLNCFGEIEAKERLTVDNPKYAAGFIPAPHYEYLETPREFSQDSPIFFWVCPNSDLFQDDVPDEFILRLFKTIRLTPWHKYQILTKRSRRLIEFQKKLPFRWPGNIATGVSAESEDYFWRIKDLQTIKASERFVMLAPLLGPFRGLPLEGISWVGWNRELWCSKPRRVKKEWVLDIQNQCKKANIQWIRMDLQINFLHLHKIYMGLNPHIDSRGLILAPVQNHPTDYQLLWEKIREIYNDELDSTLEDAYGRIITPQQCRDRIVLIRRNFRGLLRW